MTFSIFWNKIERYREEKSRREPDRMKVELNVQWDISRCYGWTTRKNRGVLNRFQIFHEWRNGRRKESFISTLIGDGDKKKGVERSSMKNGTVDIFK
ncbi:hypothetical protein TNCV_4819001 [Trichonephila clavipes]|nr:hypothetical protein TNCV_4819001 [Trichonephila clavipes]